MDGISNALQRTAVTAYDSQQNAVDPSRKQDAFSSPSAPATPTAANQQKARGDVVSFSKEALQLSSQNQPQAQSTQTVNGTNQAQNSNAYPPQSSSQQQTYQASTAQTPTQAINAYSNTYKY